jgi:hypothetical protein
MNVYSGFAIPAFRRLATRIPTLRPVNRVFKSRRMRGTSSAARMKAMKNTILASKNDGKRSVGRHIRRWRG